MEGLAGKRILITSGPTRGPIDAVRYITNKSTGRLGVFLATEALSRGVAVSFVYGKGSLVPEASAVGAEAMGRLRMMEIETVDELVEVMKAELTSNHYDAVLHSMAVLDYVPDTYLDEKTPSGRNEWSLKLVRTPKAIKLIKELQPSTLLVSFKLEVGKSPEELVASGYESLLSNGSDLVLANDLQQVEQGHHVGYLVNQAGDVEAVADGKHDIARVILNAVAERSRASVG